MPTSRSAINLGVTPAPCRSGDDIHAVLNGDPIADRDFILTYRPVLLGAVRQVRQRWSKPAIDEDDLLHEIVVALMRNHGCALRKWNPDRGSLGQYLNLFARFRTHDLLSSSGRETPTEPLTVQGLIEAGSTSSVQDHACDWITQVIRRYRARCTVEQGRFLDRLVSGASPQEMMAELGLKYDAFTQRLHRLRRRLRELQAAEV